MTDVIRKATLASARAALGELANHPAMRAEGGHGADVIAHVQGIMLAAEDEIATARAEIGALAERVKVLEETLAFYAREQSWKSSGVYMSGKSQATAAALDGGHRARAALAGETP